MPTVTHPDGTDLAYYRTDGESPTVVFFTGFASDMGGSKALRLEASCRSRGRAYLRFDYRGHGESAGEFADGTIGAWLGDALFVIGELTEGPLVLVGSSMGAWIMVLAARQIPERVAGLVGIASATDFTDRHLPARLTPAQRAGLDFVGRIEMPSDYSDEPTVITKHLLEEARSHLVLGSELAIDSPLRLIHGLSDPDIPWESSLALARCVSTADVQITLLKGGAHRLSEPNELKIIVQTVEQLCAEVSTQS